VQEEVMTDEINTELQRAEVDFDDELRDETLDRPAETASCAHGFTRGGGATPA
jgi:hypothetical protein